MWRKVNKIGILKGKRKEYGIRVNRSTLADKILDDGWMRLPCKVGDTFYGLNETEYDDYEVLGFKWGKRRGDNENILIILIVYDMEFEWGEEAFLTKEEAEQKLKERGI